MAASSTVLRPLVRTAGAAPSFLRTPAQRVAPRHTPLAFRSPSPVAASSPLSASQTRSSTYSAPAPGTQTRKKVTIQTLQGLHRKGEPIAMLTAYDFPSAHVADASGMDIILVGDSLGMVALGLENTSEVLMDDMILHCRSVARAAKSSFIVC